MKTENSLNEKNKKDLEQTSSTKKVETKSENKSAQQPIDSAAARKQKEIELLSSTNKVFDKSVKEVRRKRIKNALIATGTALAASAAIITPVIIYHKKNETYEVSIFTNVDSAQKYTITIKKGATISTLKNKLNTFEGHVLVGIYKDPECTQLYANSDEVKKDTKVYLKYEKQKYQISVSSSEGITLSPISTAVDLEQIEWGESVSFKLTFDDLNEWRTQYTVTANGEEIEKDVNGFYTIPFVEENLEVKAEFVSYQISGDVSDSIVNFYSVNRGTSYCICDGHAYPMEIYPGEEFIVTTDCMYSNAILSTATLNGVPLEVEFTDMNISNIGAQDLSLGQAVYNQSSGDFAFKYMAGNGDINLMGGYSVLSDHNNISLNFELNDDQQSYRVTRPDSYSSQASICVPSKVLNKPVTVVGYNAFAGTSWYEIILPNTITKIERFAFDYCSTTKSLVIPESVQYIGEGQFVFSNQQSVTILSPTIYSQLLMTDVCGGILHTVDEILVPTNIVNSVENNFLNNADLGLFKKTTQGDYTKFSCADDAEIMYESLSLEEGESDYCKDCRIIALPLGTGTIGARAFANFYNLETVIIPSDITEIEERAFSYCQQLKTVYLSSNITSIGSGAFSGTNLTSIVIPSTVTSIGGMAFQLHSLTNVTILSADIYNSATNYLYNYAGGLLYSAKVVTVPKTIVNDPNNTNSYLNSNKFIMLEDGDNYVYVYAKGLETSQYTSLATYDNGYYLATENNPCHTFVGLIDASTMAVQIHPNTIIIGSNAFSGLFVKELEIPSNVQIIAQDAFLSKQTYNTLTINSAYAYNNTSGYYFMSNKEIIVPKSIVDNEVNSNTKLNNVSNYLKFESGDYYHYISSYYCGYNTEYTQLLSYNNAVYMSTANKPYHTLLYVADPSITSFAVPEGCEYIADDAFIYCTKLEELTIPESLTDLNMSAFNRNYKLTALTIPSTVQYLSGLIGFNGEDVILTIESVSVYRGATDDDLGTMAGLTNFETLRISKEVVDNNTNNYLNGTINDKQYWSKEEDPSDSNYYIFTKLASYNPSLGIE